MTVVTNYPSGALDDLLARFASRFGRVEPRRNAAAYIRWLLEGRGRACDTSSAAGANLPGRLNKLLTTARWDADAVRDDLRRYVVEALGQADAVLTVDQVAIAKRGSQSVGVHRQYNPATRRFESCQLSVFLAYAATGGAALVDRELYLPTSWTEDAQRRATAGVPDTVAHTGLAALTQTIIARTMAAGVPFGWVAGDGDVGQDPVLRQRLRSQRVSYAFAAAHPKLPRNTLATTLEIGRVGGSLWCAVARRPAMEHGWTHWLLARLPEVLPGRAEYHMCYCPAGTDPLRLAEVADTPRAVRAALRPATEQIGLTRYEVRQYQAWYRHVTLAMAAQAYLVAGGAR